jgi:hypothetical protein
MSEAASWSASFGAAPADAMQTYEDIFVPRLFVPMAEVLLDQVRLQPKELQALLAQGHVVRLVGHPGQPGQRGGGRLHPLDGGGVRRTTPFVTNIALGARP